MHQQKTHSFASFTFSIVTVLLNVFTRFWKDGRILLRNESPIYTWGIWWLSTVTNIFFLVCGTCSSYFDAMPLVLLTGTVQNFNNYCYSFDLRTFNLCSCFAHDATSLHPLLCCWWVKNFKYFYIANNFETK